MVRLLTTFFSNQEIPPASSEGLPYWIFWFMLCLILLLLAFIFLRDKELRQRLDSFFIGIRKRIKKMRLQQILKREQNKIENIFGEIGKTAWANNIKIPSSDPISKQIIRLEEKISELTEEKNECLFQLESLEKELEMFKQKTEQNLQEIKNKISPKRQKLQTLQKKEKEIEMEITQKYFVMEQNAKKITQARKEILELEGSEELSEEEGKSKIQNLDEQIKNWQKKKKNADEKIKNLVKEKTEVENKVKQTSKEIDKLNHQIKEIENQEKQQSKKFKKETNEWEKNRDKQMEKINKMEEEKSPFFEKLGRLANEQRVKHKELSIYYSKIDRSEKRIKNIQKQIKDIT